MASSLLLPLAIWLLINGVDDLIVDAAGLAAFVYRHLGFQPRRRDVIRAPEQRLAIFIPCWQESSVIADMVLRNREQILYRNYDIFVGAYPNDHATVTAVESLGKRFHNVHLALCPHDGPTSKADCLNWIYQRMLVHESAFRVNFEVIVTHDAEDVIHPDAFHWINWYAGEYEMVQVPVLPLATPLSNWTHGVYCDEFTEYQCRDMPARQWMGAFVPSNGVGTGYLRTALDDMAQAAGNRIFEPVCLTEDYENGLRLKLRGARQIFIKTFDRQMATREYFPATFATAVVQRTRWATGIALQTWERHGWSGSLVDKYWLWRDRKGLAGNPASLLTNALFAYGTVRWTKEFQQGVEQSAALLEWTAALGLYRILFRMICVKGLYGWRFALGVPVRIVLGNCINSLATVRAVARYTAARLRRQPLRWVKTAHQYPTAAALTPRHQLLGQVLLMNGYIESDQLQRALATQPSGIRIGQHLMSLGFLSEDDLYEALSLQTQIPHSRVEVQDLRRHVARSLPARVLREKKVLPFQVEDGKMLVASPEVPAADTNEQLQRFTRLTVRFHLVAASRFDLLAQAIQ